MNEPLISPWVFYLIDRVDFVRCFDGFVFGVSIIAFVALFVLLYAWEKGLQDRESERTGAGGYYYQSDYLEGCYQECKAQRDMTKKGFIVATAIMVISGCILAVVPTKDTCYKMLVADQITSENIGKLTDGGKEAVDYLFDKIEEIGENDE